MAYQMAATAVTLNDLKGHSPVAGLFRCNSSNICAVFYTMSTDSALALFLGSSALAELPIGRNVCNKRHIPVSEPNFGDVRGYARPRLMARWKARDQLCIRSLIKLFLLPIAKCVLPGCFRLFALKF